MEQNLFNQFLIKMNAFMNSEEGQKVLDTETGVVIQEEKITSTSDESSVVMKALDEQEQISLEVIYEPNKLDAHNQWVSEETIAKACENFNKNLEKGNVKPNLFHVVNAEPEQIEILRTFIVPYDCKIGEQDVVKGTWVSEMKFHDSTIWEQKLSGEIQGVSIGAMGIVKPPSNKKDKNNA